MKMMIWLRAARLKLHILGMLPVLVGSLTGARKTGIFNIPSFIFAELITLFVLMATAFANDYADAETDRLNRDFNIFSGGSRAIPEGLISESQMLLATFTASVVSLSLSILFLVLLEGHPSVLLLNLIGLFVGIQYSLPPLRINYRGLGEILVMLMYSFFCVGFGYVTQGAPEFDSGILYVSVPLAISMFLMILITEVPDTDTDKYSGKKTIPAVIGKKTALNIFLLGVIFLYLGVVVLYMVGALGKVAFYGLLFSVPLGIFLIVLSLSGEKMAPQKIFLLCAFTLVLNIWVNMALSINFLFGRA
ncbi:MAG: prenyltransferase [Nitrospirota bacterium]